MADDYGTCPHSVYRDPRLRRARFATVSGFALLMLTCDDHGIFDPDAFDLSRAFGGTEDEVEDLLEDLEQRKLIEFYDTMTPSGPYRAARIIGFHEFSGHDSRRANPSRRGESLFPPPGETEKIPSRRGREKASEADPGPVEQAWNKRGSDVEVPRKGRGSDVEGTWNKRGSRADARTGAPPGAKRSVAERSAAERSPAQQSAEAPPQQQSAPRSEQPTNAAPASAPVLPALGGAGTAQGDPGGEPQPIAEPESDARPHDPVPIEAEPVEVRPPPETAEQRAERKARERAERLARARAQYEAIRDADDPAPSVATAAAGAP